MSSSQDIAVSFSQLPTFVREHQTVKSKLSQRKKEQLSTWRLQENLNNTLKELQKDSSQEAYDERVMILAAAICPRYGVPQLDETRYVIEAAKKLKQDLFTGVKTNLKRDSQKKKERYPEEVQELAEQSWLIKSTIPEPAKHANPHSAPKDGDDTVPKRLQIHTDDEAYNLFLEDNMEKVKAIMKNKCNRVREKHTSDSDYARRVNQRLDRMENSFPSKTWFLTKKPRQTKVNYEHTTGLCKDCHMSQVNHDTLLRYARMYCHCGTDMCSNWVCLCDSPDECSCDPVCCCDDCVSCQVNISLCYYFYFYNSIFHRAKQRLKGGNYIYC